MGSELDLVRRIREARRGLAAGGPPRVRSDGDFERVSVPGADSDLLRDLLLAENPGTVIEIGLAYGSSALAIAEALVAVGPNEACMSPMSAALVNSILSLLSRGTDRLHGSCLYREYRNG